MSTPPVETAAAPPADGAWQVDLRIVVSSSVTGWRAVVTGPDAIEREFVSPFDLVRFVGWPFATLAGPPRGLR